MDLDFRASPVSLRHCPAIARITKRPEAFNFQLAAGVLETAKHVFRPGSTLILVVWTLAHVNADCASRGMTTPRAIERGNLQHASLLTLSQIRNTSGDKRGGVSCREIPFPPFLL